MKRSELAAELTLDPRGVVVFKDTMRPVPVWHRMKDGCADPYYFVRGRRLRFGLLERALKSGDLSILDAPLTRVRGPSDKVSARDQEILEAAQRGESYQTIGARYGISRQRAHSIAKRLKARRGDLLA